MDRFGLSVVDDVIRFDGNDRFRGVSMDRPGSVVVVVVFVVIVVVPGLDRYCCSNCCCNSGQKKSGLVLVF